MISKRARGRLVGYVFVAPALLFLLLIAFYPLLWTVQLSVSDVTATEWHFVGLKHYANLLQDRWFWNSVRVLLVFTVPALILHFLIGLTLALLLSETWWNTTLRNFMRGVLILPWVFSTPASALMWALLLHQQGPLNYLLVETFGRSAAVAFLADPGMAMASLIVVNTWLTYPFLMIVILGGLQAIPAELYEAARVDGASAVQRFRYVTLPQLRSVLLPVITLDLIWTIGHFDLINLLTKGGPLRKTETVTYYLYKVGLLDGNLGYGAAISTLMLILLMVLMLVSAKVFSQGKKALWN